MFKKSILLALAVLLLLFLIFCPLFADDTLSTCYPGRSWMQYQTPEEAGWSSHLLEVAYDYYDMLDSAAAFVVYRGAVVAHWGDISFKYMTHSARKSLFSGLFGIYVHEGQIDLNKTLAELGIDDVPPLTEAEKQAKVVHMLKSRSGVYHEAAAESSGMKASRPPRGSHAPDTFFYYNNWDFNALCSIFNQETGRDFFEAFQERIAGPIGMEDFIVEEDTFYSYELECSIHPAYVFFMSARDMARFGLLFLNKGVWRGGRIIPETWIEDSIIPYSEANGYRGYGYMWWVMTHPAYSRKGVYFAWGAYGHLIFVVPDAEVVFVHRVNSYLKHNVDLIQALILLDLILGAHVAEPTPNPVLVPLETKDLKMDQLELLDRFNGRKGS